MIPAPRRLALNLRIIVTAGPTRERIDPVRFISNDSTGVMGFEIAEAAKRRGHEVVLISGPTPGPRPKKIRTILVESARQMERAVSRGFKRADAVIMAAAVCDWRPANTARSKIKREKSRAAGRSLKLVENPDILAGLGKKKGRKVLVGFAMETERLVSNAEKKLREKNLDIIVANKVGAKRAIFGPGRTDVVIVDKKKNKQHLTNVSKRRVAEAIIDKIERLC
ncbi:MAG: phosphopantothenoylcysteine decarboxylase [Candidatus Omnitrophota bacterium]